MTPRSPAGLASKTWAWVFVVVIGGLSAAILTLAEMHLSKAEGDSGLSVPQLVVWNLLPLLALVIVVGKASRPAQLLGAGIFTASAAVYAAVEALAFPSIFGDASLYLIPVYAVLVITPFGFAAGSLVGFVRDKLLKRVKHESAA